MRPTFLAGAAVLMVGLIVYNWTAVVKPLLQPLLQASNGDSMDLPTP